MNGERHQKVTASHLERDAYLYVRQSTLRQGLLLGSGAIESSIRRVINLRLKGNGIFWRQNNAEAMLQIRSQVISGRWHNRVKQIRKHLTMVAPSGPLSLDP